MRKILAGLAMLAIVGTACSLDVSGQPSGASADAFNGSSTGKAEPIEAVVHNALPAVVNVTTDVFQPDQFGNVQQGKGVGTGFIVRQDGIIVTNCHVVEGGSKITVSTSADKPTQYDARVIGGDCQHDLAVLKIDANGLPTVPLGDSSALELGQPVVAIGYALALEGGPTVTSGIVSSLDRTITVPDPSCTVCQNGRRVYTDVIQTDAAINHGNSGGPLLNMAGQVVGINSAGDDNAQNIGFAIAIDSAKSAIQQAVSDPLAAAAYLGVTSQTVTPGIAMQLGLPVDTERVRDRHDERWSRSPGRHQGRRGDHRDRRLEGVERRRRRLVPREAVTGTDRERGPRQLERRDAIRRRYPRHAPAPDAAPVSLRARLAALALPA